ncbi:uncharacterized protein LOC124899514 [Capsicum annuum]|uniref:uncharacterized protein LOC124899514 n=1 Tax=Capsicum annuum TaxID=4072 RepID=UPI001FB0BC54|nr:uncharacterized protein LOC124899514 [Capsicum annuum]
MGMTGKKHVEMMFLNYIIVLKGACIVKSIIGAVGFDVVKERLMKIWESEDCIKKSEINSKNHCGGREVATGTHTCGSITVGKHRKKLKKYEEIIRKKRQCEFKIDQLESYYEVAGGVKIKRLFGLGSKVESYFEKNLCACNASTSVPPSVFSILTTNLEEFVKQLIPALTTHFLPVVIECIGGIRDQEGVVLDPPPTNDDDVDS